MSKTHAIKSRSATDAQRAWTWCGMDGRQARHSDIEFESMPTGDTRFEVSPDVNKATCGRCRRAMFGKWRS